MSRPHSTYHSAPWANGSSEYHPVHSAYSSAAGPSSYRHNTAAPQYPPYHAQPWARHSAAPPATSSTPPTFAAPPTIAPAQQAEPPVTRTAHVTADGTTIYAATGRKRKRLQKACVACHKAKRRCDGGLPCSNCDFSGRTCCYSDASGKMVLPTARVASEGAQTPGQAHAAHPAAAPATSPGATTQSSMPTYTAPSPQNILSHGHQARMRSSTITSQHSPSTSPKLSASSHPSGPLLNINDIAPEHRRELISIFFSQLHPFSCVIDEISFLRDLSTSEVPTWLQMSMFALAARFQQGDNEFERERRFSNGEAFARTARLMLQQEDQDGFTLLDQPDLDLALALCFLAAHEFGMGRLQRALSYSGDAVRVVSTLKLAEGNLPPSRKPHYSRDSFSSATRRATCERLVLLTWTLDMAVSTLAAQPCSLRREHIVAATRNFGNSGDESRDEVTKSFVRLTEIASVLTAVLDANRCSARRGLDRCDDELQSWAESLGVEHKFNDLNLKQSSRMLEEPEASAASHRAWFWAQMHLFAECSVFLMEANKAGAIQPEHGQQKAAYDNIHLILSILGISGRRNLFAIPALLICTEFNRPGPDVLRWWGTARQCWNMGERQIVDAAQLFFKPSSVEKDSVDLSPSSASLTLPRLSNSSIKTFGNRVGANAAPLPSIGRLPLPSLRLSPPLSAPAAGREEDASQLSPKGGPRASSPILSTHPSWRSAASSPDPSHHRGSLGDEEKMNPRSSRTSIGSQDGGDSKGPESLRSPSSSSNDTSSISPQSVKVELYPNSSNSSSGSKPRSPPHAHISYSKDPRETWSPISSFRGEKRGIAAISL